MVHSMEVTKEVCKTLGSGEYKGQSYAEYCLARDYDVKYFKERYENSVSENGPDYSVWYAATGISPEIHLKHPLL